MWANKGIYTIVVAPYISLIFTSSVGRRSFTYTKRGGDFPDQSNVNKCPAKSP